MQNQKFAPVPTRTVMDQYSKTPQPKKNLKTASFGRVSMPEPSAYHPQQMMAVPIYFNDQKGALNQNKQRSVPPRLQN